MKVTRHEKKSVSYINKGDVYDNPYYSHFFGKRHVQSYKTDYTDLEIVAYNKLVDTVISQFYQ